MRKKIIVYLKNWRKDVNIAWEEDYERIKNYMKAFSDKQFFFDVQHVQNIRNFDGIAAIFRGTGGIFYSFLRDKKNVPIFVYGNLYGESLTENKGLLEIPKIVFDMSYKSGIEFPVNKNTIYLPRGFYHDWKDEYRKKDVEFSQSVDLLFSGTDRIWRGDNYRQRLMNLLCPYIKVGIASDRFYWMRKNRDRSPRVNMDRRTRFIKPPRYANSHMYNAAKFVLDLPWLDTNYQKYPKKHGNPNNQVVMLGWNIFRAASAGANIITYDCPANRLLGLKYENCEYYKNNVINLEAIAEEIIKIVNSYDPSIRDYNIKAVKKLFHEKHTYQQRWKFITDKVKEYLK